jgi:UDP-glucose 4-epimerase
MIKNKKVVITGGGGFIGTRLAEKLVNDNEVTLFDTNFDSNSFAFSELKRNKRIITIKGDILDAEMINKLTRSAQIVVHMAAILGVQEVLQNARYTLDVNYIGTSNLLKATAANPECERVAVFSTSEIFGNNAFRIAENGNTVLTSIQDARWCYSVSKLAAEHLAFGYFREKGLPIVVVRPFNIFGPGRVGDNVMTRFIINALTNKDLEVYGDGTQIRAWCYVDDFCDAVLKTLEVKAAIGQAFNIGNPLNTLTIYELAKIVVRTCNSKSKIVFKEIHFSDIDIRVPDTTNTRKVLNFVPKFELDEGLLPTIKWVKDNLSQLLSRSMLRSDLERQKDT